MMAQGIFHTQIFGYKKYTPKIWCKGTRLSTGKHAMQLNCFQVDPHSHCGPDENSPRKSFRSFKYFIPLNLTFHCFMTANRELKLPPLKCPHPWKVTFFSSGYNQATLPCVVLVTITCKLTWQCESPEYHFTIIPFLEYLVAICAGLFGLGEGLWNVSNSCWYDAGLQTLLGLLDGMCGVVYSWSCLEMRGN